MTNLEGVMLSEYLLLKCISKSGTADVYRARANASYDVAVKVFRPGYAQRKSFRDYFMVEAEKVGQLDHENILPFLEFGEGEGLLYTVTPFVPTGTLEDLLARAGGKLSAMQALPVMEQLCSAVQYAHEHTVIHGNIKPSNVFIAGDGRVLLADFGIAHGYDDSQQSLTRVGWGPAEYSAPEQSLGVLRPASDIYTLGVLLFRMLAGQPPFTGQTPVEVLLKHVRQQPPLASSLVPSISDAVDGVLLVAMRKRSDDRFISAKALSEAFAAAVRVAPVASPLARPATGPLSQAPLPQFSPVDEPFTPVPVHVQPVTPPLSAEVSGGMPVGNGRRQSGGLGRQANFLVDENDAGTNIFEWVGPVEWSPLSNGGTQAGPESVGEYLRSMPIAAEVAPAAAAVPPPVSERIEQNVAPPPQIEHPRFEQPGKVAERRDEKGMSSFKKILPVVVVILLLCGLLAALLSSFFYPGSHGDIASPVGMVGGVVFL